MAAGSSFERIFPGTVMPAPLPRSRERAATPRAAAISAARRTARGYARARVPRSSESRVPQRVVTLPGEVSREAPSYVPAALRVSAAPCVLHGIRKEQGRVDAAASE